MSLSLLCLLTEIMAVVGMKYLYLTGACNSESLGGRLMCLYLSHFFTYPFGLYYFRGIWTPHGINPAASLKSGAMIVGCNKPVV